MLLLWGALVAGVLGSLGPCTPLRLSTVGWFVGESRRQAVLLIAFTAGSILATAAIVLILGQLVAALDVSPYLYGLAAVGLAFIGVRLLLEVNDIHEDCHAERQPTSVGAAFLIGLGQAALVQPCCAPGLLWLIAQTPSTNALHLSLACVCFGIGQSASIIVAPFASRMAPRIPRAALTWGLGTFALMAAGYYAIQA